MTSARNFSGRVTIRLPKQKLEVYEEFKRIVTKNQHSDVCYVMGELMEAYVTAMKQIPDPDTQIVLRFMKQNIQINMGCTFHYNVKKAKRQPQPREVLALSKNHVLPNLIEQWPTLKPQAQQHWRKALTKAGIIPLEADTNSSMRHPLRSNPSQTGEYSPPPSTGSNPSRGIFPTQTTLTHTLTCNFNTPTQPSKTQNNPKTTQQPQTNPKTACDKCHTQLHNFRKFLKRLARVFQWK